MSYAAIYVVGSLQSPLPWTEAAVDMSLAAQYNRSASEYFWAHVVLNKFDRLEGLGPVQPMVAGALLGVWALVFLSLVFGKAVLAKVTWVTVVRPASFLHLAAPRAYLALARALGPAPAPAPSPQPQPPS